MTSREFSTLVEQWRAETILLSDPLKVVQHPAYHCIIAMGTPAIPLILHELETRPDDWFKALQTITGINPVPCCATFNIAVQAWLEWGHAQGYLPGRVLQPQSLQANAELDITSRSAP